MSVWPSSKARKVFSAIERVGWSVKANKGSSHKQLTHPVYGEVTWAFHDGDEIGPKMLARLAKVYRFKREDL
ncbi:MAG: type II toxin-antitoxin system HicA family toxin [Acidobacteriota bacterium]|nr:type II toxin-antitoxin system HicA family toxin [Acidobacteriota bacterium]